MAVLPDIPFDVLVLVLRHLSVKDIVAVQNTCHCLRDTLDEHSLWAEVHRAQCKLYPVNMDYTNCQDPSDDIRKKAIHAYQLRCSWTVFPRSFHHILSRPSLLSAELLPGGDSFVAAFSDGSLSLIGIENASSSSFKAVYRCTVQANPGISATTRVALFPGPQDAGNTTIVALSNWQANKHQITLFLCDELKGSLRFIRSISTQLLLQRFTVGHNMLAVVGYAVRAEHRVYVHIFSLSSGDFPERISTISLDDTIDVFGELLGVSLVDENNLLVCFRRGVAVFRVSSGPFPQIVTNPAWSQDLSDWYSHSSDCSIGRSIGLYGKSSTTVTACALVTGDRFFVFGMMKRSSKEVIYTVRPLEILQSSECTLECDPDEMDVDNNTIYNELEPFRDRSARLMKCSFDLAVWLSSEREQLMTASLSPLSAFSVEQRDALGLTGHGESPLFGFDVLPHEIAVGGIDLPAGLELQSIDQLSIDEISGRVGIFRKDNGEFLVAKVQK